MLYEQSYPASPRRLFAALRKELDERGLLCRVGRSGASVEFSVLTGDTRRERLLTARVAASAHGSLLEVCESYQLDSPEQDEDSVPAELCSVLAAMTDRLGPARD